MQFLYLSGQWKNWPDLALQNLVDAGELGAIRDPYDSQLYVHRVD